MTQRETPTYLAGRNPVREALEQDGSTVEKVWFQKGLQGGRIRALQRLARDQGVPVQFVPRERLNRMVSGVNHQGVVALAGAVPYVELEAMLHRIAPDPDAVRARKPLLLVLDQIEDPHNLGALLRSAVAAGAQGVIVPSRNMAPVNAAAVKTSAGTARRIPIARVPRLTDTLDQLKERGYWVAGAAGDGETSLWAMDWDRPLALIIGNEERGLRPRIADACDYRVSIPLFGPAESLNASVAAGILLFAAARVRAESRKKD